MSGRVNHPKTNAGSFWARKFEMLADDTGGRMPCMIQTFSHVGIWHLIVRVASFPSAVSRSRSISSTSSPIAHTRTPRLPWSRTRTMGFAVAGRPSTPRSRTGAATLSTPLPHVRQVRLPHSGGLPCAVPLPVGGRHPRGGTSTRAWLGRKSACGMTSLRCTTQGGQGGRHGRTQPAIFHHASPAPARAT